MDAGYGRNIGIRSTNDDKDAEVDESDFGGVGRCTADSVEPERRLDSDDDLGGGGGGAVDEGVELVGRGRRWGCSR